MTTKQETALAVKVRVGNRVAMSGALLERMGYTVEQYERVCLNALLVSPGLSECTPASMDIAITHCITAGLIPDGKEAVIVPFKGAATLIPMVDGIVKCAHNAIKGLTIRARVVYQGDEFEYRDGARVVLNHTMGAFCDPPRIVDKRPVNIIAAYAVAQQPGSMEPDILVFDRATLDIYRGYSRARSGPWETHYEQMCGKTLIKQLLKRMPKAVAMLPEPPQELEMLGYDLVAPDGLEGVISNPALNSGVMEVSLHTGVPSPDNEVARTVIQNPPLVPNGGVIANAATGEIIDEPAPNEPEMPPPSDDDDDSPF